jgi:hypothetical protein
MRILALLLFGFWSSSIEPSSAALSFWGDVWREMKMMFDVGV